MADLKKEYQFFLDNKKKLIEQYSGMYIVISNQEVAYVCANENDAYNYGVETFGLGNFIIQLCTEEGFVSIYHSRVRIGNGAI